MTPVRHHVRDHYLPPDPEAFRRAEPKTGRVIVIAPTRAACETIELACQLDIDTVLLREHGDEIRGMAAGGRGFGIMAATGTGKTLAIRPMAEAVVGSRLRIGVVNREREATPETPSWNVVIVTTGIARRWFQDDLIDARDTVIVDEIHQTSAELELCLALGKRAGCRFVWLSATVDPSFYRRYLDSVQVIESSAFDPSRAARVWTRMVKPIAFLEDRFLKAAVDCRRGVAVFLPTRAEVESVAHDVAERWPQLKTVFYHGGEPIRVIRPFLDGTMERPFLLTMTQAGQSALNISGLDTVVIYDACYNNHVLRGRNVLKRDHLGPNEILQMAGRVHGRVANGEVHILTDRDLDFASLSPVPPQFQLAGDSERVALTAAALGVELEQLDLPVPLDRRAHRRAVELLRDRGIIDDGRLTRYGRDVEAMPVDRAWAELLVHAPDHLAPFVAVAANTDSLHRMTRDEPDLTGLIVYGSDHLTSYNVFAEAVNLHADLGQVYGLERHVFREGIDAWAADRGVLVKALEDIALGMASVYRTLELPLPTALPRANAKTLRGFRELVARVQPFDLVVDGETADGERVRASSSSIAGKGILAGSIRYFADRFGVARGALEGTSLPHEIVKKHVRRGEPRVVYQRSKGKHSRLAIVEESHYFGFVFDRSRHALKGVFPEELREKAQRALARALMEGSTDHPRQARTGQLVFQLDEIWRRSGGRLPVDPLTIEDHLMFQLTEVTSYDGFMRATITLNIEDFVSEQERRGLEELPTSVGVLGDRIPLRYEIEDGRGVAVLNLREKQARRLRRSMLPVLDRPLRLAVTRGRREVVRVDDVTDLRNAVERLPQRRRHGRRRGR